MLKGSVLYRVQGSKGALQLSTMVQIIRVPSAPHVWVPSDPEVNMGLDLTLRYWPGSSQRAERGWCMYVSRQKLRTSLFWYGWVEFGGGGNCGDSGLMGDWRIWQLRIRIETLQSTQRRESWDSRCTSWHMFMHGYIACVKLLPHSMYDWSMDLCRYWCGHDRSVYVLFRFANSLPSRLVSR